MELSGFTAVDTVWELKGLELAQRFHQVLFGVSVAILIGVGIVRALHKSGEERHYRGLVFYLFYSIFMVWLIQPVPVAVRLPAGLAAKDAENAGVMLEKIMVDGEFDTPGLGTIQVPRILAWTTYAVDRLQKALVLQVNPVFTKAPFGEQRASVLLRSAKILDPDLEARYHAFVLFCMIPTMADRREHGKPEPERYWDPFAIPFHQYARRPPYDLSGRPIDASGNPTTYADGPRAPKDLRLLDAEGNTLPQDANGDVLRDGQGNIVDEKGDILIAQKDFKNSQIMAVPREAAMCDAVAMQLFRDLAAHVKRHPTHLELRQVLERLVAARRESFQKNHPNYGAKEWGSAVSLLQLDYVLYNETSALFTVPEVDLFRQAVPPLDAVNNAQQSITATGETTPGLKEFLVSGGISLLVGPAYGLLYLGYKSRGIVSGGVKLGEMVNEKIKQQAEPVAMYYRFTLYGPTMYGASLMVLLAIFPLAGCVALLPGHWKAILGWAKYLLWVKLWIVLWSILSAFNQWRIDVDLSQGPTGIVNPSEMWPGLVAMYVVTPALSLIGVNLISAAASSVTNSVGSLTPSGGAAAPVNVWSAGEKAGNAAVAAL